VYEDDVCLAFRDIEPQAKAHILVIPKRHIASLNAADEGDEQLLGHLLLTCGTVAREQGLAEKGYRVISNIGKFGCQSVELLHIHILGGQQLSANMA
jgi:histidine triad (HIT) family protein